MFERLQIPAKHEYLKNCYDVFHTSQEPILKAHQEKKDLIEQSNQLAEIYFKKHKNEYSEFYFDQIFNNKGA